ncbi:MAG TPA: TA system VapC family ribonuclease toxin [Candidatus Sulfopaludibacter sp.]|jgi:hypothetical protein|nr:TA system VapC family ribonuclease toxin [Candidatus Sulfopaludibacter sp.]
MILLDVNVLLYAYDLNSPENKSVAAWLEKALSGTDTIGIPLVTIWGFLRIGTNSRILANPLPPVQAFKIVRELLEAPGVMLLQAGPRHLEILQDLVQRYKVTGPLISDGVIAALAIEHGATVASTDRDFSRFDTLKWINPAG